MTQPTSPVCACGHHHTRHIGQETGRPELHCIDCPCPQSTVDTRWQEYAAPDHDRHDQGETLRAAQIAAAREVLLRRVALLPGRGWTSEQLAAEVVDAVLAAPSLVDATHPHRVTEPTWRVGRHLGRTLYHHGQVVGMVDSPELAARIVEALEAAESAADGQTHPDPPTLGRSVAHGERATLSRASGAEAEERGIALGRRKAAVDLQFAAHGRRQYGRGAPDDILQVLHAEADLLDLAANVAEGHLGPLYGWLPSWLWTAEMHARLDEHRDAPQCGQDRATHPDLPDEGRSGRDGETAGRDEAVCICPQIETSSFHELPGAQTYVKGLDPNCPACGEVGI